MNIEDYFGILEDYAIFRPVGSCSLNDAVRAVADAIALGRERQQRKLLVDVSGLTGFDSPSITDRYWFIRDWAEVSGGKVQVALVARPEMIDPQKFGMNVAANAGLLSAVFPTEAEAVAWLRGNARTAG